MVTKVTRVMPPALTTCTAVILSSSRIGCAHAFVRCLLLLCGLFSWKRAGYGVAWGCAGGGDKG